MEQWLGMDLIIIMGEVTEYKTLWVNKCKELIDDYTKLYENVKPEKPDTISHGPIMNIPQLESS